MHMFIKTGYNAAMPIIDLDKDVTEMTGSQDTKDWVYWKNRSYEERMVELEKIRQMHYAGRDNVPTRLLGVVKIIQRSKS
jgi:hypothetical protein